MLSTEHEDPRGARGGGRESSAQSRGRPRRLHPRTGRVDLEALSAAVTCLDGATLTAGDAATHRFTFQSTAKLLLLAGLLEERGPVEVFRLVGSKPSGQDFASLARLETHGPRPANPLLNAGAIALASQLSGTVENKIAWLLTWVERLYGARVDIDDAVRISESTSANRNRAIAYLLRHNGILEGHVEDTLEAY